MMRLTAAAVLVPQADSRPLSSLYLWRCGWVFCFRGGRACLRLLPDTHIQQRIAKLELVLDTTVTKARSS
eukprot:9480089-Pyramimonas_sp.AAC.1